MLQEALNHGPDGGFVREISACPGAETIRNCIQCGVCSGSCPMADAMPDPPRRVLAHVLAGDRERALGSETIWYCASCFTCSVRCPQGVSMADVMFALRSQAMDRTRNLSVAFYRRFTHEVTHRGRIYEARVAMVKGLHGGARSLLREMPLGLGLFRRGRLSLLPHRIQGSSEMESLARSVAQARAARRKEAEGK